MTRQAWRILLVTLTPIRLRLTSLSRPGWEIADAAHSRIAEALLRLYENEDERQSIAASGRKTALHIANGAGARMYEQAVRNMLNFDASQIAALPLSSHGA